MKKVWEFFNGHKTIIFSIIFIILQSPIATNYISPDLGTLLLAIFGALGGASLVHHVKKAVTGEDK